MEAMDMGSEPVDVEQIVMPTEEKIVEIGMMLAAEDRQWSQIKIRTAHESGQRTVILNTTNFTAEEFEEACGRAKAMLQSTEGQAFIQAIKVALRKVPLVLKTSVVPAE